MQALNDRVVQLARSLKVTRGRKLRVDTTAVETNIHFPTDSGLLGDGVRVVSRLLRRAKAVLGEAARAGGGLPQPGPDRPHDRRSSCIAWPAARGSRAARR